MGHRLFLATFLPERDREQLAESEKCRERLQELWDRPVRFTLEQKIHLTWAFIGDVEESRVSEIAERLSDVISRHSRFEICWDKLVLFPSAKSPRYICLVPSVVPEQVRLLDQNLREQMSEFMARPETRPLKPHVTLARLKEGRRGRLALPDWLPALDLLPVVQPIDQVELIESRLHLGKDAYQRLSRFALK